MRSVVPSESATVPLPDHVPSKPTNGPDCAWLADTDHISAVLTAAILIVCPNQVETSRFILLFPFKSSSHAGDVSPHRDLVSPQCVRFKRRLAVAAAEGPVRSLILNYSKADLGEPHFRSAPAKKA